GDRRHSYPFVGRVPILIDETKSIFDIDDFVGGKATFFSRRARWQNTIARYLPDLGRNFSTTRNFARLGALIHEASSEPLVLIIGAGHGGQGISALSASGPIEIVNCDVSMTDVTDVIGDAHH